MASERVPCEAVFSWELGRVFGLSSFDFFGVVVAVVLLPV